MQNLIGLLGVVLILAVAFLLSNNRKAINYRTVGVGLFLQLLLGLFILKTTVGKELFSTLGRWVTRIIDFSNDGAMFVFGPLAQNDLVAKAFGGGGFIFFFKIIPTIIFVAVLVNIFYYFGIIQFVVKWLAIGMKKIMNISGAEALSNIASTFVGQVEAQIMIKPYLKGMTNSELTASMAGSYACIAGGVMATYIQFGVKAEYLIAASIMAAPGALAIAKIMFPETEESETKGEVSLKVKKEHSNFIDAVSAGCSDGLKVGLNVLAMLIGFLALIALINFLLGKIGGLVAMPTLSLDLILGYLFAGFAWAMGVPSAEIVQAGSLMGTKLAANEFVAYLNLKGMMDAGALSPKTIAIVSFALCGFANFGSLGIQIGGISALEPSRREDLTKVAVRALIAGTLASYMSATIAGLLF
ncbi:MAG: NupC/NupG family nucleoside CNT transporter [Cytophagaceae bacterium BCCC1]|nr:MAG: NupC/NupG family nucleoside CNT transporter [Cytophagaceae bacterium BCCC1]